MAVSEAEGVFITLRGKLEGVLEVISSMSRVKEYLTETQHMAVSEAEGVLNIEWEIRGGT